MGETGALDLSEVNAPEAKAPEPAPQVEIEISPLNEDGTPRSRREMRQLREEALAAQAAAAGVAPAAPETEAAPDPAPVDDAPAEPEAPVPTEAPAAPVADDVALEDTEEAQPEPVAVTPLTGEMDFDSLISPPTEPFTVDELREAEQSTDEASPELAEADPAAEVPVAEAPAAEEPAAEVTDESTESAAPAESDAAAKPKRRFPWQRNRAEDSAADPAPEDGGAETPAVVEVAEAADAAGVPVEVVVEDAPKPDADPETIEVVPEPIPAAPAADAPTVAVPEVVIPAAEDPEVLPVADPVEALVVDEAPAAPAEPVSATQAYSFPDIAPPEEWRSVFDDPASRNMPGASGEAGGDFDDLISRAVAQEGAAGNANTSALILPTMPEDTGGLTGPLGGTGELYVTGSLKLPKSLGETGGHSALHDSIEIDPITGAESEETQMTGQGPAPVSARHAVSARMDSSIPVVAKPAKERSKLPLVLSLTGGGLLVAVVALGIWGASNGMFG